MEVMVFLCLVLLFFQLVATIAIGYAVEGIGDRIKKSHEYLISIDAQTESMAGVIDRWYSDELQEFLFWQRRRQAIEQVDALSQSAQQTAKEMFDGPRPRRSRVRSESQGK